MQVAIIHMRFALKGGLETRLHNYISYFLNRGDEVTVICSKIEAGISIPDGVKVEKVDISIIPKPIRILFFNFEVRKVLNKKNYDFALSMGRTYVQPYSLAPNTHKGYLKAKNNWSTTPSDWLQIWLDYKTFKLCKRIYACSDMVKQEMINLYNTPAEKVLTVYPPLNEKQFYYKDKSNQRELKLKLGLDPDKKTFLFVSASHKRKGIDILLEVFDKLQDTPVELAIAGGDDNYGRDNIKALGFVKDVNELYWAGDFTIHPAIYEPFGQIISESLSCGTPVLIGEKVGAKEIVKPQHGILVKNDKPETWLKAVNIAFEDDYEIESDFAQHNHLTLSQHMDKILSNP